MFVILIKKLLLFLSHIYTTVFRVKMVKLLNANRGINDL